MSALGVLGTGLRLPLTLWRLRWSIVRLAVAVFLLWVLAADTGARLARLQLSALPGFDYVGEVKALRAQGRYGEAVMIADSGLQDLEGDQRAALEKERAATVEEQESYVRRAKDAGMGALSGRGDSLEALAGAVAADFFLVGDIRDLLIEGGKQVVDGESDELILLLSAVGVATTLVPEIDWVPAILKAARRAGAMSEKMASHLKTAIKGKKTDEVIAVMNDTATIAKKGSPGAAIRLLKHADDPADLKVMANFVEKHPTGVFALRVTGKEGLKAIKAGGEAGEQLVIAAAKKGRAGASFLQMPAARMMLRPHPLIGLAKAVWKGNAAKVVQRVMDRVDPKAWWIVPLLAAWVVVEVALVGVRVRGRGQSGKGAKGQIAKGAELQSAA